MKIVKRTFDALKLPRGSAERERANSDWLTSEYMPSHRYGLREDDGSHTPFTYRSKAEAILRVGSVAQTQ